MNSVISPDISIYWFARSADLLHRVADSQILPKCIEWRNDFQQQHLALLRSLTPGHIVVLELNDLPVDSYSKVSIPSSSVQENVELVKWQEIQEDVTERTIQDPFTKQLQEILSSGNMPTILYLGHGVPAERIVRWMRMGIFLYAERESPTDEIIHYLCEAMRVAKALRDRYQRFEELDRLWLNISQRETAVLEMVLDGIPNKTIASRLNVSQRTIEARRQRLYQKLESRSLPGVVQKICEWKYLQQDFGKLPIQFDAHMAHGLNRPHFAVDPPGVRESVADSPFFFAAC